jgi:hypothetical protein
VDAYDLINAAAAPAPVGGGRLQSSVNRMTERNGEAGAAHRYRLFGLAIASDLALPELRVDQEARGIDVAIRLQGLPQPRGPLAPIGEFVELSADEFRLSVPDVGDFMVRDAREIFVCPWPGASAEDVRAYLLGSVFGGLLHQAGLLPLHASAVASGPHAAAFLGHSGAGKSTLAHRLGRRGHPLLSDDVCVVHGDTAAPPLVWPGIRQFKLWQSSLAAAGESPEGLRPVLMRDDKFLLPTAAIAEDRAHRLELIYLLGRDEGTAESRIEALNGIEAVNALVSNTYRGVALRRMGRSGWHLSRCAALARQCRVFSFTMAWGFERADKAYALLEEHMLNEFERGT